MIDFRRKPPVTAWLDISLLIFGLVLLALLIGWAPGWPTTSDDRPVPHLYSRADLQSAYKAGVLAGRREILERSGWPAGRPEAVR